MGELSNFSVISILIFGPLLGALCLTLIPAEQKGAHRGFSAAIAGVIFLVSLPLALDFDNTAAGFQGAQQFEWIPAIGASWQVGLDGISLWIVILTTFLTPLILIGSFRSIDTRVREFSIAMLVLESAMIGALVATDLLLFYLFWELMLIPMYLLIGIWGGKQRIYATVKFFIYTLVGSLLMLVGVIYLWMQAGQSFAYEDVLAVQLSADEQLWLFAAFALAFGIKVPIFPFHTWLPDAHTQAPTAGSVILAGVLLKMGTYGFLRFALPLFPHAMGTFSPLIAVLAVFGIVYGALLALAQNDIKKLVAYSSVSHLGFVMLGIVALNQQAVEGAILQMINHGISTGALFLLVGMVYERRHTREISDYGGIATSMPLFAVMFVIVTMSSIGLPTTNGFVGEFLILSGAFAEGLPIIPGTAPTQFIMVAGGAFLLSILGVIFYRIEVLSKGALQSILLVAVLGTLVASVMVPIAWPWLMAMLAGVATTGVVLGAVYMLHVVRRVFFGPITHEVNSKLEDLSLREVLVIGPLVALIFLIGLFPNTLLEPMHKTVGDLLQQTKPIVSQVRDEGRTRQGYRVDLQTPELEIRVAEKETPQEGVR